jgi:predicted RecA/RadA family phage recombinase
MARSNPPDLISSIATAVQVRQAKAEAESPAASQYESGDGVTHGGVVCVIVTTIWNGSLPALAVTESSMKGNVVSSLIAGERTNEL